MGRSRGVGNDLSAPPRGEMRAQILAVSTRLFAAHGRDGTSLQDIAEVVGVKKPSLLHHFASKDALYQAVLDELLARWKDTLPQLLLAAGSGEKRFDDVWGSALSFFADDPSRARLLMREALDRPDEMRALLREHVRPWMPLVAKYLERGKLEGVLHPELDVDAYVIEMVHLVLGGIAVADVLAAMMPDGVSKTKAMKRQLAEMSRIARASLFVSSNSMPNESANEHVFLMKLPSFQDI
ncbi:MAG: TetR/AcrR family transcriptional regulator [Polyangiaceae bacterium]